VDDHQFGYTTQMKNKTLGIYQRKTNDRYFKNSFQTLLFGVNGGLFSCVFFLFIKVDSFKTHANKFVHTTMQNDIPILEMQRVVQNELEITLLQIVIHSK